MANKKIQMKDNSGNNLFPATDLASAGNINVLPIARGGTGATTPEAVRDNLSLASKSDLAGKQDVIHGAQAEALNSTINKTKVDKYEGYDVKINSNTTEINNLIGKPGLDKVGTVTKVNGVSPNSAGEVTITIPSAVTETTVSNWGFTKNKGTVTSVATSDGLTGGTITSSGTLKANLKSYTKNTAEIGGKLYAVELDKNGKLAVSVPWTDTNTHQAVVDKNPTLSWGTKSTVATIGGTSIHVTMPANPSPTNYVTTNTEQTITGKKTFDAPASVNGTEQATAIFKTANGGRIILGKEGPNDGSMIALDQVAGTRRLNFRASSTAGAIVWSQPENDSSLYYDVTNVYFRESTHVSFDSASTVRFAQFTNASALGTDSNGNLKKVSLAKVATSGSYDDLSNKPATENFVPYTGAEKDIKIRDHTLFMLGNNCELTFDPANIIFHLGANYEEELYIDARTVTVINDNVGDPIYWPGAKDPTPGAKVFALTSDITSHAGIDKVGTVTKVNGISPNSAGEVTITIPSAVTETTVSNWGFTKNKGTVTELTVNGLSKAPNTNGTVDLGSVCTYTNAVIETKLNTASRKMENVTWDDLKFLKDEGKLIPGMRYRITDYTATVNPSQTMAQSAGHQFDIIVTADDEYTLNENATAAQSSKDTYFKDCDLASWKLKYCLDNDISRFQWADEKDGKGVIYWMEDEFHNQVPYDFKNIMFKRYKVNSVGMNNTILFDNFFCESSNLKITDCISPASFFGNIASIDDATFIWCYTFCTFDNDDASKPLDASINLFPDGVTVTNYRKVPLLYAFDNTIEPYIIGNGDTNTTKTNYQQLNNIVFMKYSSADTKHNFSVYGNRIKSHCALMTFGGGCARNTLDYCGNMMFGFSCIDNTISGCTRSVFSYKCSGNSSKQGFNYNLLCNTCQYNRFGGTCQYLELGEQCSHSTFGNNCHNLIVCMSGNSKYNTFEDNVSYVQLDANSEGSDPLQYITVAKGVSGTGDGSNMLSFGKPRGLTHTVTYQVHGSETIDV